MTRANRDRLFAYKGWLNRENENGTPLVAYTCPSCLEKLHTVQAPDSEVWDTFSKLPFLPVASIQGDKGCHGINRANDKNRGK